MTKKAQSLEKWLSYLFLNFLPSLPFKKPIKIGTHNNFTSSLKYQPNTSGNRSPLWAKTVISGSLKSHTVTLQQDIRKSYSLIIFPYLVSNHTEETQGNTYQRRQLFSVSLLVSVLALPFFHYIFFGLLLSSCRPIDPNTEKVYYMIQLTQTIS